MLDREDVATWITNLANRRYVAGRTDITLKSQESWLVRHRAPVGRSAGASHLVDVVGMGRFELPASCSQI
jgi:hypothetical protein